MNRMAAFIIIFCLNSVFTYAYIYFLLGTFDVQELWDSKAWESSYFLYDVLQYNLSASSLGLEEAINYLVVGSTAIHATVLGYFFDSDTLYSGLIVNSVLVALTLSIFLEKNKVLTYLLLAPFFLFYSIGWTKEIIYTLALAFFLRSTLNESKRILYSSFIATLLSRPQYAPLQLVALLTKKVSQKHFAIFILAVLAFAPIWLTLVPTPYTSAAEEFYEKAGGQGITVYTDYLKTNVPIASIIGYMASVAKLYYEPLSALIESNGSSVYAWVEFYVQIILLISLIRSRFYVFKDKTIFNLFLLTNLLVSSLPFTHFRYMLPLLVALFIYNMVVLPNRIEQKAKAAGYVNA